MKITTEQEARAALADRVASDSILRFVWTSGSARVFVEKQADGGRILWAVGPRGGIQYVWRMEKWQFDALI